MFWFLRRFKVQNVCYFKCFKSNNCSNFGYLSFSGQNWAKLCFFKCLKGQHLSSFFRFRRFKVRKFANICFSSSTFFSF